MTASTAGPYEQAAALPVSGLTAWQAIHTAGRVEAGQQVLVLGSSGGVGSHAVQVAHAAGAEVTAVCSAAKVDFARELGADHVLAYEQEDVAATGRRFDLVLDVGGVSSVRRLRSLTTAGGTVVFVGGEGAGRVFGGFDRAIRGALLSPLVKQRLVMFVSSENSDDLARLTELVERGQLSPVVDRTFPLDEAPAAMDYLLSGQVRGKVVLRVT